MKMPNKLMMVIAASAIAASAMAAESDARSKAKQVFELKDGSSVYIFKDGKMAMESKMGKAERMEHGKVMETKDGQLIMMHGDEVMVLKSLLGKDKGGK